MHYVSLKDGIDTSNPTLGKILVTVFGLVSELELENIKIRTTESRLKRYREGKSLGGVYVSLGYKRLTDEKGETYFEIDKDEAKIIKYIFESYAYGMSKKNIVNNLNEKGYKTRANNAFKQSSIDRILKNPVYIGKIRYNNPERNKRRNKDAPILVDGLHDAIISKDLWERVQKKIIRYKITRKRNFEEYLFSSKIICSKCGSKMYGKRTGMVNKKDKRRHKYYKCFNQKCSAKALRVDLTDNMLLSALLKIIDSKKFNIFIKDMLVKETYKANNEDYDIDINNEIDTLKARKNNLIEQYAYGLMDEVLYSEAIAIVNDKLDELRNKEKLLKDLEIKIDKATESKYDKDIITFISNLKKIISDSKGNKKLQIEIINEIINTVAFKDVSTGKAKFELYIDKDIFLKVIGDSYEGKYKELNFQDVYRNVD